MNYVDKMKEYYYYILQDMEGKGLCAAFKPIVKAMFPLHTQIDSVKDLELSLKEHDELHKGNETEHDTILSEYITLYEIAERHPSQYLIDAEIDILYNNNAV